MTDPTADAAKLLSFQAKREITHDEAKAIAQRLINSHFHNVDGAHVSIPADPERDDDLLILSYIEQQRNTRPQTAPPAGELKLPDWPKRDGFCPVCNGNDYDVPCAYPTERPDGCWRIERLGLAARPKVEDAEVEAEIRSLRGIAEKMSPAHLVKQDYRWKAADLLERLAVERDDLIADRDGWKQQHENLVSVRETDIANLAAKIDGLKAELDRRKGDPRTRLYNLCEALQEDLDKSPYTREEWEQVDRETVELQHKLREAEAKLAEREAELANARAALVAAYEGCPDEHLNDAGFASVVKEARKCHAARQQQKASAEPTEREGK